MKKKFLIIAVVVALTGFIGWNAYQIYLVPDNYNDAAVYYNGTLPEYKTLSHVKTTIRGCSLNISVR